MKFFSCTFSYADVARSAIIRLIYLDVSDQREAALPSLPCTKPRFSAQRHPLWFLRYINPYRFNLVVVSLFIYYFATSCLLDATLLHIYCNAAAYLLIGHLQRLFN
jgi:hypothetical protein